MPAIGFGLPARRIAIAAVSPTPPNQTLERPRDDDADYEFTFEPAGFRLHATFAGVTVVDSARVMVMRETRLAPVYYFPCEDVRMDLMSRTDHRTWCPFKGNASYWSLAVGNRRADDVMWSYETPLPEAAAIAGHVAFYADKLDAWFEDGERLENGKRPVAGYANPLVEWLLTEAPYLPDQSALTHGIAEHMVAAGVPLWRFTVIIRTLHPQLLGVAQRWWRAKEGIDESFVSLDVLTNQSYLSSPFVSIFEGVGGIRRRLEGPDPVLDYEILRELHAEGATDYVAMPLVFSDGQINALTLSADRPGGFATADLGHLYEVLPLLARLYEVHTLRYTATTLLDTYLGHHAGQRVLRGQIKRGDGENIDAVIWFCDLRESTPLAQALGHELFLETLNRFFDCLVGPVLQRGGQVLRYIGDAALAIFPVEGDPDAACNAALSAAREAVEAMRVLNEERAANDTPALGFGIGLHLGTVTYGNIGTGNRLEFTVIGDAANRAARIEGMSKTLDERVILSAEVAGYCSGACRPLGKHALRGVDEPVALFALDLDANCGVDLSEP